MAKSLFELRGKLSNKQNLLLTFTGTLIVIGLWWIFAAMTTQVNIRPKSGDAVPENQRYNYVGEDDDAAFTADSLLSVDLDKLIAMDKSELDKYGLKRIESTTFPTPSDVFSAGLVLIRQPVSPGDDRPYLLYHMILSIWLNFLGYIVAILFSIPIGFALGLIPLFRGLFSKIFDALRFVPLAAATYLFILVLGTSMSMKVTFLAVGIMVYLIPVVVQRIDEVQEVYLKTVFTLGASKWQTVRSVYIPSVMSRLFDDIRVLTAISWTYITIAEMLNNEGGLGSVIYTARRHGADQQFAVLFIIIIIGILQDRIFVALDRWLFPHKHISSHKK